MEPLFEDVARAAGEAVGAVKGSGVVDAIVMASAASRGDHVLTSDWDDLNHLRAHFPEVRLLSVRRRPLTSSTGAPDGPARLRPPDSVLAGTRTPWEESNIDLALLGEVDEALAARIAGELDEPLPDTFDVCAYSRRRHGALREPIDRVGRRFFV